MAARTLLFDLDGTLWDSYPWYASVISVEAGLSAEEAIDHFHQGLGIIQLANRFGLSKSGLIKACCHGTDTLNLYPEARNVLIELKTRGIKMGIVTNLSGKIAEPVLINLELFHYFTSLIYAAKKPSPSGIYKALAQLNHNDNKDIFYIGDTLTDSEAARRANIPFAWASFGYSEKVPPNTSIILSEFADILAL